MMIAQLAVCYSSLFFCFLFGQAVFFKSRLVLHPSSATGTKNLHTSLLYHFICSLAACQRDFPTTICL